jgi:nicotinamide mononucleotide transporter
MNWILDGFKGWMKNSYRLLAFAIVVQIIMLFTGNADLLASIGGILGVVTVCQISNMKQQNGLFGLISALLIAFTGLMTMNFGVVAQQILYILVLDLPILLSKKWKNADNKLTGFSLPWIAVIVAGIILGFIFSFSGANVLLNTILFMLSFTASLGTVFKKSFVYPLWFVNGLMSIIIFAISALTGGFGGFALLATYLIYLGNVVIALFSKDSEWKVKKEG